MVVDKGKKCKIEDNPKEIDERLLLSIEKLREVQAELEKINDEATEKVLEIEHKYDLVREPVYDKRSEAIKSIPDFWLTAFLNHPALGELLTEDDKKVFKYLDSLEVRDFKDMHYGYSIIFNFQPNPYFEDEKLSKTFKFIDNEGATKITASPIKWKEGMQLPNGVDQEKKGNKRAMSEESFFSWFYDVSPPFAVTEEFNDEIADIIKDDFWVNPLAYFNNEADEEDGGDEGKESDDSDENDDDVNGDGN